MTLGLSEGIHWGGPAPPSLEVSRQRAHHAGLAGPGWAGRLPVQLLLPRAAPTWTALPCPSSERGPTSGLTGGPSWAPGTRAPSVREPPSRCSEGVTAVRREPTGSPGGGQTGLRGASQQGARARGRLPVGAPHSQWEAGDPGPAGEAAVAGAVQHNWTEGRQHRAVSCMVQGGAAPESDRLRCSAELCSPRLRSPKGSCLVSQV